MAASRALIERGKRAARRAQRLLERPADPPLGVSLFSEANQRRFEHWVWTPPGASGPLPLVVVLHGVVDAAPFVLWQRGRVKETAARLVRRRALPPFALVLAGDTGADRGSLYADWADGTTRAETYVMTELLAWADANLTLNGVRHIMGVSMGGYGALKLALRHPGAFASASAVSGFMSAEAVLGVGPLPDFSARVWGSGAAGVVAQGASNIRALVAEPKRSAGLRIAFDCGTQDHLIEENRAFHALLGEIGVRHGYAEHGGGHTWEAWRDRFADHLLFHLTDSGALAAPVAPPVRLR